MAHRYRLSFCLPSIFLPNTSFQICIIVNKTFLLKIFSKIRFQTLRRSELSV